MEKVVVGNLPHFSKYCLDGITMGERNIQGCAMDFAAHLFHRPKARAAEGTASGPRLSEMRIHVGQVVEVPGQLVHVGKEST